MQSRLTIRETRYYVPIGLDMDLLSTNEELTNYTRGTVIIYHRVHASMTNRLCFLLKLNQVFSSYLSGRRTIRHESRAFPIDI
ncbi:hypothetical protein CEAn_00018 [Coxiella endosymbiont of Amblyomma nuttalli]|nr:hypothetical protein CEAn_00018 [Coxiella endosymbiont of Amblyomma nuttalli]